jgi:small subunit ribosomal protein S1
VGDEIFVKVIDIDLERRRISLSLKQANESSGDTAVTDSHFDPTLYGMAANYDPEGNYIYPDGFDSETNEWLPGHEEKQAEWERQYAEARARFEAHQSQIVEAQKAEAAAGTEEDATSSGEASSTSSTSSSSSTPAVPADESTPDVDPDAPAGSLASDAQLEELRRKLTSGES